MKEKKTARTVPAWAQKLSRVRLRVRTRLLAALGFVCVMALVGTAVIDFSRDVMAEKTADVVGSGWEESVSGYVVADEGCVEVELFTEGLSHLCDVGRGIRLELESWEPYVGDDGSEYYHAYYEGRYGYIPVRHIANNVDRVLKESQIYVRTATNLHRENTGLTLGSFLERGTALNVLDYDYLDDNGSAHMYQVKYGDETGWISSEYVAMNFLSAMENYDDENETYLIHSGRNDVFGGGSPRDLDYYPRTKGDFADVGNAMPESSYSLYIPCTHDAVSAIDDYLALARGTKINTFVFTIYDDDTLAWPCQVLADKGILDYYTRKNSDEEFAAAVQKVRDAGYYTVGRMTAFQDYLLARECPELAVVNASGSPALIGNFYYPSPYSRDVWQLKARIALEAVEKFGFDEIMLDYVQFTFGMGDVEDAGGDLRNEYGEARAQTLQRFLMYMADVLHEKNTYLSVVAYAEGAESHVNSYGLYWPAYSNVVDAICCTAYPESFSSYWTSNGMYYPSRHPYSELSTWAAKAQRRQNECPTPAVVRTWIQCWDTGSYEYDKPVVEREILALFDNGLTGGYMPWNSLGDLEQYGEIKDVFSTDYYALWQQAEQQGKTLSEFMNVDTSDEKPKEEPAEPEED